MDHTNSYVIPIILENGINHVFLRANFDLLNKHTDLFPDTLTYKEKMPILKNLWEQEYNIQIIFSDEYGFHWEAIKFQSNEERMLFLLSWSSE